MADVDDTASLVTILAGPCHACHMQRIRHQPRSRITSPVITYRAGLLLKPACVGRSCVITARKFLP